MKVLTGSFAVLFLFCQCAQAQLSRGANLSPNLFGSIPQETTTGGTIALPLSEAIDRALKYNFGPIISEQETRVSRAERVRSLSELMPKVTGTVNQYVQQINLAAYGFNGFPGAPLVVGPFSLIDARAKYTQNVVDFKLLHELRSSAEKVTASNYAQDDVRELVVLIATDLYLESVAAASRVDAVRAQVKTAQAVYDRAVSLKNSGVVPGIDVLRAQVQLQTQQQRVVAAENDFAKEKLNLARAIGLPQGQAFTLTDSFVKDAVPVPPLDQALTTALESRPDYKRSLTLIK